MDNQQPQSQFVYSDNEDQNVEMVGGYLRCNPDAARVFWQWINSPMRDVRMRILGAAIRGGAVTADDALKALGGALGGGAGVVAGKAQGRKTPDLTDEPAPKS